ncbi:phage holin [Paenibacillus elgii]
MDFQPFISDIAQSLVGLLSLVAITAFFWLKKHFIGWIDSKTTGQRREVLHKVAEEAFAFVEASASGQKGAEKLNLAIDYVNKHLSEAGIIQMDPAVIRAAVEKAVLMHNASMGQGPKTEAPAEQSQPVPVPEHVQKLLAAVSDLSMAEKQVENVPWQPTSPPAVDSPADPTAAPPTQNP